MLWNLFYQIENDYSTSSIPKEVFIKEMKYKFAGELYPKIEEKLQVKEVDLLKNKYFINYEAKVLVIDEDQLKNVISLLRELEILALNEMSMGKMSLSGELNSRVKRIIDILVRE